MSLNQTFRCCDTTAPRPINTDTPVPPTQPANTDLPVPQPTDTQEPTPMPTDTSNIGKIGETLSVTGVLFRVDSVRIVDQKVTGSQLCSLQKGHVFLVLDVYMENVGSTEGLRDVYDGFHLTDNQGVDLGSDINPTTAECVADQPHVRSAPDWKGRPAKLELGQSAQGVVVFDIPKSSSGFTLIYKSFVFIDGNQAGGPTFQIALE